MTVEVVVVCVCLKNIPPAVAHVLTTNVVERRTQDTAHLPALHALLSSQVNPPALLTADLAPPFPPPFAMLCHAQLLKGLENVQHEALVKQPDVSQARCASNKRFA